MSDPIGDFLNSDKPYGSSPQRAVKNSNDPIGDFLNATEQTPQEQPISSRSVPEDQRTILDRLRGTHEGPRSILDRLRGTYSSGPRTFVDGMVDPYIGMLYGMGQTARDTGARAKQVGISIGEKTGFLPEGSANEYTRDYDKKRAIYESLAVSQGQGFSEGAGVGKVVQSIAQVPIPAVSLAGRVAVGGTAGAMQYVPEGDTTLGVDSNIANPMLGATGAAVAPYVIKGVTETAKAAGNVARGVYNKASGSPDPFLALKEQGYPIAKHLAGLNDIQPPNALAIEGFRKNADVLHAATGKKPEALISQQLGSDRAAKAEASTAAAPSITDRAFNERQRIIQNALSIADDIAAQINKSKISPERGGKILAASQNRAISSAWDEAEVSYRKEAAPVFGLFKNTGDKAIIGQRNQLNALNEIEQTSAVQGQSNDKVFSAIGRTAESLSKTGNINIDAAVSRRSSFSKLSKSNKFLGIDDPATAKQAAWRMAEAVEADIAEAAMKVSARTGIAYEAEALKKANAAYYAGAEKARSLEDSVFGSLLEKKNATFDDFVKASVRMPESQFRGHMAALREVNPGIDKKLGRLMMDKARADSRPSASAPPTSAEVDPALYYKSLSENKKFFATFPDKERAKVKAVIEHMKRLSDRVGATGGGQTADPLAEGASRVHSAVAPNAGFVARNVYRFLIGPTMDNALYTEAGRSALLTVSRDYLRGVPSSAYAEAIRLLESE